MKEENEEKRIVEKDSKKKNIIYTSIAALIGIVIFLIIYGFSPLNVTKDNWILAGYDEVDIIQHYAGWMAFRNSDWSFPIGMADKMAVGDGTVASYVDCIPWLAILFKLIRGILPETFQYFGLYVLLCFALQAIAGYKIIYFKTKNQNYALLGASFLCFAPILLDRAFKHTGLGSQWLILFAIYVYMKHCENSKFKDYIAFTVLEVLAIGIHPYFLPAIGAFAFLATVNDLIQRRKKAWLSIILLILVQVVTVGFGFILGTFGVEDVDNSRWGYGFFSMNLNSIINPINSGYYNWSSVLKVHPYTLGNYDGFNFLGLGILCGIFLLFVFMILANKEKEVVQKVIKNIPFLIVCVGLTAFAVTNVVTFNDKVLLQIKLPEAIQNFCGNFRGSGRIFYPVFYSIFLYVIYRIYDYKNFIGKNKTYVVLGLLILIQVADMRYCFIQKHNNMKVNMSYQDAIYHDEILNEVAKNSEALLLDSCGVDTWKPAAWAFKNRMSTYYSIAGTGLFKNTKEESERIVKYVRDTGDIGHYVILTSEKSLAGFYQSIGIECREINRKLFFV